MSGNLSASDRIELKQTARYEGDLRASKLVVDEGAIFNGHVSVGPDGQAKRPQAGGQPQHQQQGPQPRPQSAAAAAAEVMRTA